MQRKGANISLKGYDDIFSTEQSRAESQQERVQEIPLSELHPFEGHPFRVVDDEEMMKTAESVRDFGVLTPAIVRPDPDGGYEIVSGHRRHRASELAGKETMPAIVRDLDDDAAIILMVDANLQRETILPSERAFAYKMKLDAIKHQGERTDLTSGQLVQKLLSVEKVAEGTGESYKNVQRYIRLTELIPELLDMVDTGQIKFNPAVELSYLASEEQKDFLSAMDYAQAAPSLSQAQRIKKLAQEGECTLDAMCEIMNEIKKGELDRVTFKTDSLRKYFPKSYTNKQMEDKIIQLLEQWQKKREKSMERYPRTDSRYLTSDMKDMLPELIKSLFNIFPVEDVKNVPVHAAQVINDKKVSDHHAIIPTKEAIKCSLDDLPKGEQAILRLIATRLFCAVGEPFRYNESVIELSDGNYIFSAKGKTTVQSGWKIFSGKPADKDKEGEKQLPSLTVGEGLSVYSTEVKEGKTSPPKHFTEDTLLQSMETAGADEMPEDAERKGLGTPATRAATIEKLVRIGFLERKGDKKTKHLISTHKGTALVTVMPEQIQSPSMTADWEEKLLMIERGEYDSNAFLKEIQDMISALVQTYEKVKGSDVLMAKEVQTVGVCPVCGSSVTERQKGFFCSKRECHFALWKNSRYFESIGKSLTSAVAQKLLSNGEVKLKGCKSAKTGRMYDATVVMTVTEEGKPQFNMNFENGGKSK